MCRTHPRLVSYRDAIPDCVVAGSRLYSHSHDTLANIVKNVLLHYLYVYGKKTAMNTTQSLKIYELLNVQFGQPERARQFTEAIEAVVDEKISEGNKAYETLFHKDLEVLRLEYKEGMARRKQNHSLDRRLYYRSCRPHYCAVKAAVLKLL